MQDQINHGADMKTIPEGFLSSNVEWNKIENVYKNRSITEKLYNHSKSPNSQLLPKLPP